MRCLVLCLLLSLNLISQRGIEIIQSVPQLQSFGTASQAPASPGWYSKFGNVLIWAETNSIAIPSTAENEINSKLYQNIDPLFKADWLHIYTTASNRQFAAINWATPGTFNAVEVETPDFELKKGFKAASGAANYLRTGYTPSSHAVNFKADTGTFGLVIYAANAVASNWMMGSRYGSGGDMLIRNNHFRINNATSPDPGMNTIAGTDTLCITVNRAGTNTYVYVNGVQHYAGTSAIGTLPAIESFIIRANEDGNLGGSFGDLVMAAFTGGLIQPANQAAFSNEMKRAIWRKAQLTASSGGGAPPPVANASSPLASRTVDVSDVNYWISLNEATETNRFGEHMELIKMLDTSDIKKSGNRFSDVLDTLIPDYAWAIPSEDIKQSWRPTDNLIEWKQALAIDTFGIWTGNNFNSATTGIVLMAGNSIGEMHPISDTLRWNFSRKFSYFQTIDADPYKYFSVLRYTIDRNGYMNQSNVGVPVKLILAGTFSGDSAIPPLPYDTLPTLVKATFSEQFGINSYPGDTLDLVAEFAGKSWFVNPAWHETAPGEDFAIFYPWLGAYNLQTPITGSDGLPTEHLRGGYTQYLKSFQRKHPHSFFMMRFQDNNDADLYYRNSQYYSSKSNNLISWDYFITDTTWFFPDKYRSYPVNPSQNAVDTLYNIARDTGTHDFREAIAEKWFKQQYYPVPADSNFSDWIYSKTYLNSQNDILDTSAVSSISKAFRIGAENLAAIADPLARDSILVDPNTYREFGELMFSYSAIMGRNAIPPQDCRVKDYTKIETGIDAVDAVAILNEPGKDWQQGIAHYSARQLGMMLSVHYDGHGGLVQDLRGGYRVGAHTADPSMKYVLPSDLTDDMSLMILALKWCEYFRQRDFDLMPDNHPYSGEAKHIQLKNVAFDVHVYMFNSGISSNQTVVDNDFAVTWEEYPSRWKLYKGASIIRALWPSYEIYCSEYGYGNNGTHRLGASKALIGLGYDSIAGDWIRDTTYDLLDAQASNNDWHTFHLHRLAEKTFHYKLVDEADYSLPILNPGSGRPYAIDRDEVWRNQDFISGFPSNGLVSNIRGGAAVDQSNTKKPCYFSASTLNVILKDAYQIGYTQDFDNKVAQFTYFDSIADTYFLAIRRYTQVNGTASNYSITIPDGHNTVTRIEPIRAVKQLPVTDLGNLSTYVTDVREKYFILKCERP